MPLLRLLTHRLISSLPLLVLDAHSKTELYAAVRLGRWEHPRVGDGQGGARVTECSVMNMGRHAVSLLQAGLPDFLLVPPEVDGAGSPAEEEASELRLQPRPPGALPPVWQVSRGGSESLLLQSSA